MQLLKILICMSTSDSQSTEFDTMGMVSLLNNDCPYPSNLTPKKESYDAPSTHPRNPHFTAFLQTVHLYHKRIE